MSYYRYIGPDPTRENKIAGGMLTSRGIKFASINFGLFDTWEALSETL